MGSWPSGQGGRACPKRQGVAAWRSLLEQGAGGTTRGARRQCGARIGMEHPSPCQGPGATLCLREGSSGTSTVAWSTAAQGGQGPSLWILSQPTAAIVKGGRVWQYTPQHTQQCPFSHGCPPNSHKHPHSALLSPKTQNLGGEEEILSSFHLLTH